MKKRIFKFLALFFLFTAFCYLGSVIIGGSFNPWQWPEKLRYSFALIWLILSVALAQNILVQPHLFENDPDE